MTYWVSRVEFIDYLIRKYGTSYTLKYISSKLWGSIFTRYRDIIFSVKKSIGINVSVTVFGNNMRVSPNCEGFSKELHRYNMRKEEEIETWLVRSIVKPGMTVLDVGANHGYYVLQESDLVGKNGRVIAVEPNREIFNMLQDNVVFNRKQNITVHNIALGDKEGMTILDVKNMQNHSMIKDIEDIEGFNIDISDRQVGGKIITSIRRENVKIDTGDNFLKGVIPDMIRMDTQGYEVKIINGLRDTLFKMKPGALLYIECHGWVFDKSNNYIIRMVKGLEKMGFEIFVAIAPFGKVLYCDFPLKGALKHNIPERNDISAVYSALRTECISLFMRRVE